MEISNINEWSKQLGITNDYSILTSNSLVKELSWDNVADEEINKMLSLLYSWADNEHKQLKVKFFEWILKNRKRVLKSCVYCKKNLVIYASGDVYACFNNKNLYFGNINTTMMEEIIFVYQKKNHEMLFENCFSMECIGTYI